MRLLALLLFACGVQAQQAALDAVRFTSIAAGFNRPTDIVHAGDGSDRLFIVEQAGRIWTLDRQRSRGQAPFLDIRARVGSFANEQGLLGLAFHPGYATNGRFFVYYTNRAGNTVVSEFRVSGDPEVGDPDSETIFLTANQPFGNHNGGQIHFGSDGMLYIGTGDGGSGGDPMNLAQNLGSLLGKILRVDVDNGAPAKAPPDNPFVGRQGARPEIWAYGLRNPWRWSFDRQTGDMWISDVGQDLWEEVNFAPAGSTGGRNYGWRRMEGRRCFNPGSGCNDGSLTLPVIDYGQTGGNCSVTGGYRYRGAAYPSFAGVYFYADFCSGAFYAASQSGAASFRTAGPRATPFRASTFGEDEAGEIYMADFNSGSILLLEGPRANPAISEGGVVNAASFAAGQAVAPGSIASVFGAALAGSTASANGVPLPAALAGASLAVRSTPSGPSQALPLFFVSPGQANAQVPWELEGQSGALLTASADGQSSPDFNLELARVSPGIFTMDQSGSGQAAALISGAGLLAASADRFPNARPARLGEFLEVFATGLGPVSNRPASGAASPSDPLALTQLEVTARVGGVEPVAVRFAGLAPGFIGLYQVNLELVGDLPSGAEVELVLFVDGVASNAVTIAIE